MCHMIIRSSEAREEKKKETRKDLSTWHHIDGQRLGIQRTSVKSMHLSTYLHRKSNQLWTKKKEEGTKRQNPRVQEREKRKENF